jgi:phage terminase large subunit-like protein
MAGWFFENTPRTTKFMCVGHWDNGTRDNYDRDPTACNLLKTRVSL